MFIGVRECLQADRQFIGHVVNEQSGQRGDGEQTAHDTGATPSAQYEQCGDEGDQKHDIHSGLVIDGWPPLFSGVRHDVFRHRAVRP